MLYTTHAGPEELLGALTAGMDPAKAEPIKVSLRAGREEYQCRDRLVTGLTIRLQRTWRSRVYLEATFDTPEGPVPVEELPLWARLVIKLRRGRRGGRWVRSSCTFASGRREPWV